jgi:hypothetical protein
MPADPSAPTEALPSLVARSVQHINALRRQGNPAAVLAPATAAADAIEQQAGDPSSEEARVALTAAQRFTFNVAADCWPGWSTEGPEIDRRDLSSALRLAQLSSRLVDTLGLGGIQQGTGIWLTGAFHLALGAHMDAATSFATARERYVAANAPGLALLTEGYLAINRQLARQLAPESTHANADTLEQVCSKITAGGFKDGADWIAQLHTALEVFGPT